MNNSRKFRHATWTLAVQAIRDRFIPVTYAANVHVAAGDERVRGRVVHANDACGFFYFLNDGMRSFRSGRGGSVDFIRCLYLWHHWQQLLEQAERCVARIRACNHSRFYLKKAALLKQKVVEIFDLEEHDLCCIHVVAFANAHFVYNVKWYCGGGFRQLAQRCIKVRRFSMALTRFQRDRRLLDFRLE